MSIEEIDRLLNELKRLDTSSENARLSINTKALLEEIKTAKEQKNQQTKTNKGNNKSNNSSKKKRK